MMYFQIFLLLAFLATVSRVSLLAVAVGHGLALDKKSCRALVAGFIAGDFIWLTLIATQAHSVFVLIATQAHSVFAQIRFWNIGVVGRAAAAAYLLFLAYKLWTSPRSEEADPPLVPLWLVFGGCLLLSFDQPTSMLFDVFRGRHGAFRTNIRLVEIAMFAVLIATVAGLLFFTILWIARYVRSLSRSEPFIRTNNRIAAVILVAAAVATAANWRLDLI